LPAISCNGIIIALLLEQQLVMHDNVVLLLVLQPLELIVLLPVGTGLLFHLHNTLALV